MTANRVEKQRIRAAMASNGVSYTAARRAVEAERDGARKDHSSARHCVFCGGAEVSREHVWPKWLASRGPKVADNTYGVVGDEKGLRTWRAVPFSLTARVVCFGCNHGWMADLEDRVAREFPHLMDGESCQLYASMQEVTARWALKTVLMLSCTIRHQATAVSRDDFRALWRGEMPARTQVWLGRRQSNGGDVASYWLQRFGWFDKTAPDVERMGYSAVLVVHELVFLLVVGGAGGDLQGMPRLLRPEGPTTARMLKMWPTSDIYSINWPPPVHLVDADVEKLSTVIDDLSGK